MANTKFYQATTSDGLPIKLIDNGDGTYSLAVSYVNNNPTSSAMQFNQTQSVTVANTVTETSVVGSGSGSMTLAANALTAGSALKIRVMGVHSAAGNPTVRWRIKLGGTTILDTTAENSNNSTNTTFDIHALLTCRSTGASGTVIGQGTYIENNSTNIYGMPNTSVTTIDTTSALALDVTMTWGTASASNTLTVTNILVEIIS